MQTPKDILLFRNIELLVAVGEIFASFSVLNQARAPSAAYFFVFATIGVTVFLTLLVSQSRSNTAKWIVVIFFIVGIFLKIASLNGHNSAPPMAQLAGIIFSLANAYALSLLFSKESAEWLTGSAIYNSTPPNQTRSSNGDEFAYRKIFEIPLKYAGDKKLSNDGYKIYLTRKYKIEKNEALNKIICSDRLFDDINEALLYADIELEKNVPNKEDMHTEKKATCPICDAEIFMKTDTCPSCQAWLGAGSTFKPIPKN